jgi:hypothetical protein
MYFVLYNILTVATKYFFEMTYQLKSHTVFYTQEYSMHSLSLCSPSVVHKYKLWPGGR